MPMLGIHIQPQKIYLKIVLKLKAPKIYKTLPPLELLANSEEKELCTLQIEFSNTRKKNVWTHSQISSNS